MHAKHCPHAPKLLPFEPRAVNAAYSERMAKTGYVNRRPSTSWASRTRRWKFILCARPQGRNDSPLPVDAPPPLTEGGEPGAGNPHAGLCTSTQSPRLRIGRGQADAPPRQPRKAATSQRSRIRRQDESVALQKNDTLLGRSYPLGKKTDVNPMAHAVTGDLVRPPHTRGTRRRAPPSRRLLPRRGPPFRGA